MYQCVYVIKQWWYMNYWKFWSMYSEEINFAIVLPLFLNIFHCSFWNKQCSQFQSITYHVWLLLFSLRRNSCLQCIGCESSCTFHDTIVKELFPVPPHCSTWLTQGGHVIVTLLTTWMSLMVRLYSMFLDL